MSDATTTTAEVVADAVDAATETPARLLGTVVAIGAAALAAVWLTRRLGQAAMTAAAGAGHLDPPAYVVPVQVPADDPDPDTTIYSPEQWGDHTPAGSDYAR